MNALDSRAERGITLVELVVTVSIVMIVGLAAGGIFVGFWRSLIQGQGFQENFAEESLFSRSLNKRVPNDLRIYGFAQMGGDRWLARMVVPVPDVCTNLSSCPGATTLFMGALDPGSRQPFSAICARVTSSGQVQLLLDSEDPLAGFAGPSAVPFKPNDLILSMVLPAAVLMRVVNHAQPFPTTYTGGVFRNGGTPLPPECAANLFVGPSGHNVNRLVQLQVAPYVMSNFTGPVAVPAAEVVNSLGAFPQQVAAGSILAMGLLPEINEGKRQFSMVTCEVNESSSLDCNGPPMGVVGPYHRATIFHQFSIRLKSASGPIVVKEYEVGASPHAGCAPPQCQHLFNGGLGAIPGSIGSSENATNLNASQFSMTKQDVLRKARFELEKSNGKYERIQIAF